jgi:nucleoside-diphosphate-sugar epimerase
VATKLAAEILLGPYCSVLPVIQLRLFTPYGEGQNRRMLVPQLIQRVWEGRAITLHGPDGLRASPVAASDVAEAICRCLAVQQSSTFNVAGPNVMTLREMGLVIGRVLDRTVKFDVVDQEPLQLAGEVSALRSALRWSPATTFEDGLSYCWSGEQPFPAVA